MDAPLKELAKLEKFTGKAAVKGKTTSIAETLDSLLHTLHEVKQQNEANKLSADTLDLLAKSVETRKKEVDERQKEIYSSVSRIGKALDKVRSRSPHLSASYSKLTLREQKFPTSLPSYPDLFTSDASVAALERTIALHFLRTGQFDVAETFLEVGWTGVFHTKLTNAFFLGIRHRSSPRRSKPIRCFAWHIDGPQEPRYWTSPVVSCLQCPRRSCLSKLYQMGGKQSGVPPRTLFTPGVLPTSLSIHASTPRLKSTQPTACPRVC